ncbi:BamA/TamA family outer membrane protein [Sodaliphilus sp.]|uniref:translocation and assembly module lipoprotein TamL n=1 Tax=Sodaliphilus sp. TaxID=2815818 RepID=UPI00388DB05D
MNARKLHFVLVVALAMVLLPVVFSCSSTKHVPDGKLLLDKVKINVDDKTSGAQSSDLVNYLRQSENHKVLGGLKLQLAFYNLSGKDSSSWFNRWIQRVGTPPVIYDSTLTASSALQLHTALKNKGYMNNVVDYDVVADSAHKKAKVNYNITLGSPYYISSIGYDIANDTLRDIILEDTTGYPVKVGGLFDRNKLDAWRQLITEKLRNHGYYAFNKEYITFTADTAAGSHAIDVTLNTREPYRNERMPYYTSHKPFYVRNVTYVTNYDPVLMQNGYFGADTLTYNNITIMQDADKYLHSNVIDECNYIEPGSLYNAEDVNRTYKALGRLNIVKFINIDIQPVGEFDGKILLDAYVLLSRDKSQSFSVSLEGTNSEGDLGFGLGMDYRHRNVFKGSESLNAKFKMSYESLSGDLSGLINNNYSEYSGELGLNFPKFKFPLLKSDFKKKIQASTELTTSFNYQERPEYTRIIAGAGWRYHWTDRNQQRRHTFNLLDLNYVYLPKSRSHFLDSITNPLLRYSYEDHFIMRMGYNFYLTNKRTNTLLSQNFQRNVYTLRANAETAGNVLYAISSVVGHSRNAVDAYKVFGIRYAQYAKVDADYSITHNFDTRSSLAFHVGAGVAVPYGNSTVLPFEKRFYSGGANSVRGWGVRTLGPGSFNSSNSQNSFIYQCGDIRLDLNLEYRAKLFWVIELGAFIDAGNIWTIRDYEDQPGGVFKFNKFYEQIAMAYGLGLRLDFTYFLLRIDMGMKAHNPVSGQEHWPLFSPKFKRDSEFHFSVGYPF